MLTNGVDNAHVHGMPENYVEADSRDLPDAGRPAAASTDSLAANQFREHKSRSTGYYFPVDICCCLPVKFRWFMPRTWHYIQDVTHMILLMGFIAGMCMLVEEVWNFARSDFHCNERADCKLLLSLVLVSVTPNICYIGNLISTFDESIREREREVRYRKQSVLDSYESLIDDIQNLLSKATQSSALLAETEFESARRDFVRCLGRIEERSQHINCSDKEMRTYSKQFANFTMIWLKVFSECSIDPIDKPRVVVQPEELATCRTLAEIAHMVGDRLRGTEVRFISAQADIDAATIADAQNLQDSDDVSASVSFTQKLMGVDNLDAVPEQDPEAIAFQEAEQSCPCDWGRTGIFGCACRSKTVKQFFPKVMECLCFQLTFLSWAHVRIILGAGAGVNWIARSLPNVFAPTRYDNTREVVLMFLWSLSLLVFLMRFEHLDIISKLETEIQAIEEEQLRLAERQEQMKKFWQRMSQLTDIWIYRTAPRLELVSVMYPGLEELDQEEIERWLHTLKSVNKGLEELEGALPELDMWLTDGLIELGGKRAFIAKLKGIYEKHEGQDMETIETMLLDLQGVVEAGDLTIDPAFVRRQQLEWEESQLDSL